MLSKLVLGLVLSGATPTMSQLITHGKAKYVDSEFAEAIAMLDEALARPEVTPAQRQDLLLYIGFCQIGLGNDDAARGRFREVLRNKPDTKLPPGTSPKIRDIFERVRASMPPPEVVRPVATPASSPPPSLAATKPAEPAATAPTPVYKTWWLWTIVAVAAGGIAAGTYFGVTASHPAASAGTLQVAFQPGR